MVLVVVASCGDDGDGEVAGSEQTAAAETTGDDGGDDGAAVALDLDFDQTSLYEEVVVRAEKAVADLGSDEAAIDALLRALEAGYDSDQIQQAVDAIIQMMERLEIEASYEQARHPKSSPPMLRAAVAIAVFGATIGIGALYLTIR